MKCQYIIAGLGLENPTTAHLAAAEGEKHLNGDEQTLGLEDSDQSTVNGGDGEEMVEKDEAVCRNDIEPTQPYFAGGTGEEEHIEYENTVPYKEEGIVITVICIVITVICIVITVICIGVTTVLCR